MTAAIHYTPTKPPNTRDSQIYGLQVAVSDWLRAYLRYAKSETLTFLIGAQEEWREIQDIAAQAGTDPKRLIPLDRRFNERNFADITTIFRAEPDTRNLLWQRQLGNASFAFCGLSHAISGVEAGEVLQEYCLAPSLACDAIISPSRAVRSAIYAFWDSYSDFLRLRFGANYRCPVQCPVIPLGIDSAKFAEKTTPDKRAAQRRTLGIGENDIVLLWVGRLSAAIKAHPLAMFQAAERSAELTGARIHLVMQGYFVPKEADAQFRKLADAICGYVTVTFIAANDPRFPDGLWAAGDIFLSLIDNIQESFGLTPIEAMAAGLPRVVSDWDGYRDSVTDGEDGFLIRTTQPPAGNGFDLTTQVLMGREVYGGFLAKTALTVAIDAQQAGDRIAQLITDKNLRAKMVEKARLRLRAVYDWQRIIPAYEEQWQRQAAKREKISCSPYRSALPQLPDPYTMYAGYPTSRLDESNIIALAATVDQIKLLLANDLNTYAHDVLISATEISDLLSWLGKSGETPIQFLFARYATLEKPRLWRTIAWLQKMGIIRNNP